MFLKKIAKIGSLLAVAAFLCGSANAVTVNVLLNDGQLDGVLDDGDFASFTRPKALGELLSDTDHLQFTANVGGVDVVFSGPLGISGGFLTTYNFFLKDLTTNTMVQTVNNLLPGGGAFSYLGLIAGHNYEFTVSLKAGNVPNAVAFVNYIATVSAVPVPPALLLLGTGLLGAGALGRRRNKAKKISV